MAPKPSQARAAKDKFKPGSEWQFFVIGPRDADPWTFRVVGREKVQAGAALGDVDAVHVMRTAPPKWLSAANCVSSYGATWMLGRSACTRASR